MKTKNIFAALAVATTLLSAMSLSALAKTVEFNFDESFEYPAATDTFEPVQGTAYQLYDAFQKAENGDIIKLNCDVDGLSYKSVGSNGKWSQTGPCVPDGTIVTLDLNGHTIYGQPWSLDIGANANVTITDTAATKGMIKSYAAAIFLGGDNAKLTLTGGVVLEAPGDSGDFGIIRSYLDQATDERFEGVEIILDDCTINGNSRDAININSKQTAKITINNANVTAGTLIYSNAKSVDYTIKGGTFDVTNIGTGTNKTDIKVEGGNYTEKAKASLAEILPEDKELVKDPENPGKFVVTTANATINGNASNLGFNLAVDGLKSCVDMTQFDTYDVKISSVDAAAKAALDAIEGIGTYKAYDISIEKTDSNGAVTEFAIPASKSINITVSFDEYSEITAADVYHYDQKVDAENVKFNGNKITVENITSLSPFAFANIVGETNAQVSKEAGITFNKVTDDKYEIIATALEDFVLYRLMSADITFVNTPAESSDKVVYTITPAYGFKLIEAGNNRYEFHCDTAVDADVTAAKTVIGYVNFGGFGEGTFGVDMNAETNVIHTAKEMVEGKDDNIVVDYTVNGETYKFKQYNATIIDYDVNVDTADLKINVLFPNDVENKAVAYEDMTVTVAGGDIDAPIVVKLGATPDISCINASGNFPATQKVTAEYTEIDEVHGYEIVLTDALVLNSSYTVTVEGAGYRTARYTVTMTDDKELNFWNNVKDAENEAEIETGKTSSKTVKNFLAGDIVKDNNINIYDLSAVVSYFGATMDTADESTYAKYDLNRDGKIDSKDVAYVLVSWNN